jgi:hypothetical protein
MPPFPVITVTRARVTSIRGVGWHRLARPSPPAAEGDTLTPSWRQDRKAVETKLRLIRGLCEMVSIAQAASPRAAVHTWAEAYVRLNDELAKLPKARGELFSGTKPEPRKDAPTPNSASPTSSPPRPPSSRTFRSRSEKELAPRCQRSAAPSTRGRTRFCTAGELCNAPRYSRSTFALAGNVPRCSRSGAGGCIRWRQILEDSIVQQDAH